MAAALLCAPASALGQTEGDYLYRVTVLRAAPGHFTDLLGTLEESFGLDQKAGDETASWMRHSQGDQWDFIGRQQNLLFVRDAGSHRGRDDHRVP